jgi:hypothetical protein
MSKYTVVAFGGSWKGEFEYVPMVWLGLRKGKKNQNRVKSKRLQIR